MIVDLLGIAGGLVLLVLGAEALVRGSVRVAVGWGMTPLIAGLTVAAFGTSSPELVVSVRAGLEGSGGIAAGNVIGSNICNIALILGMTALIRPLRVHSQIVRIDIPVMLGVTALMVALLWNDWLVRVEGAVLVVLLIAYLAWSVRYAKKTAPDADVDNPPTKPRLLDYALIPVGIGVLVLGGSLFVNGATDIARALGVGEAVIGLTLVAAGTSLPEFATTMVAALRGELDVAVGNVVGSNIFNVLGILGLTAVLTPFYAEGILLRDYVVLGITAIILLPMVRSGFTLTRAEGAVLLAGYVAYVVWLYVG